MLLILSILLLIVGVGLLLISIFAPLCLWAMPLMIISLIASFLFAVCSFDKIKKWKRALSIITLVTNCILFIPASVLSIWSTYSYVSTTYKKTREQQKINSLYGDPYLLINNFYFYYFAVKTDLNSETDDEYYDLDGKLKNKILSIYFVKKEHGEPNIDNYHFIDYSINNNITFATLSIYENGSACINVNIKMGYELHREKLYFEFDKAEFVSAYEIAKEITGIM